MSDKQDKKYEIILFAPFRVLNFIFHYIIALISSITNYPILEQRYRNLYNYIPTMNYNNAPPVSLNISDALNNLRNAISNHPSPATPIINSSAMRQSRSAQQLNQINNSISPYDRSDIIEAYVRQRRSEYEVKEQFTIYAGTWNSNGQMPEEELFQWLSRPDPTISPSKAKNKATNSSYSTSKIENPDMYVLGFQELDLTKDAYIYTNSLLEREWIHKIEKTLGSKYYKVQCHRLASMMIAVYIKSSKMKDVKDINFGNVGTGLMNQFGNKGGVAVSMKIKDTSCCFIASHLAAQMDNVGRRNQDYQNIINRMFKDNINGRPLRLDEFDTTKTITNHDVILWLGDLNYRIYADRMNDEEFRTRLDENLKLIQSQNAATDKDEKTEKSNYEARIQAYAPILARADQLSVERQKGSIFELFHEELISFPPTYKYDIGTDIFDTSEKARQPAWTDRILYRHSNNQVIKVENYRSHMCHKISDHKPVSAEITLNICAIDDRKKKKVQKEVIRKLDSDENENRPSCTLSEHALDFGQVLFRDQIRKVITVKNDGKNAFKFSIGLPGVNKENHNFKEFLEGSSY